MLITGVPFDSFTEIVAKVSAANYEGNLIVHPDSKDLDGKRQPRIQARMRTRASRTAHKDLAPGSKYGFSGRATPSACWHTYRDVLTEMFERYPNARAVTAMARYEGKAGFEANYPATAEINVGSMVQPMCAADVCECLYD